MVPTFLLVVVLIWNILAIAISTSNTAFLAAVDAPVVTPSPSAPSVQDLTSIFASISSLLGLLQPPSSVTSELSAFPTSILSALEGPNAVSAFDELYTDRGIAWMTALPSGAESWLVGLPAQAATILPQVISLQSLANNAVYASSPTRTPPPNDFFPTTTSTVTSTSSVQARRGITEGQQIGAIVGSAAFLALAVTFGVMIYDHRKKRMITKAMRANHAAGMANRDLIQLRMPCPQQHQEAAAAELGIGGAALNGSASYGVQQEVYELHSPEIGHE